MWAAFTNALIGLWLMLAPAILGYGGVAADSVYIAGPVIATFSITALWECTRGLRKWNYVPAVWLLMAPWILGYHDIREALWNDSLCGLLVIFLSSIRGKMHRTFAGGWASLWK